MMASLARTHNQGVSNNAEEPVNLLVLDSFPGPQLPRALGNCTSLISCLTT